MEYREPIGRELLIYPEDETAETAQINPDFTEETDPETEVKPVKFSLGMKILAVEFGLFLDMCVNFLDAWVQ